MRSAPKELLTDDNDELVGPGFEPVEDMVARGLAATSRLLMHRGQTIYFETVANIISKLHDNKNLVQDIRRKKKDFHEWQRGQKNPLIDFGMLAIYILTLMTNVMNCSPTYSIVVEDSES